MKLLSLRRNLADFESLCKTAPEMVTSANCARAAENIQALAAYNNSVMGRLIFCAQWAGVVLSVVAGMIALFECVGVINWSFWAYILAALVCGACFVRFVICADEWIVVKKRMTRVSESLAPLDSTPSRCTMALLLVTTLPAAAKLRDIVVGHGEVLRGFHLDAFYAAEELDREERQQADCRALHLGL